MGWDRDIPALGHTAFDFERRVNHDRLRRYRLSRAKQALDASQCGALLLALCHSRERGNPGGPRRDVPRWELAAATAEPKS